MSSVDREILEEKIGEAIGLEMAAQKAVEGAYIRRDCCRVKDLKNKMEGMRKEASNHQTDMEDLVRKII